MSDDLSIELTSEKERLKISSQLDANELHYCIRWIEKHLANGVNFEIVAEDQNQSSDVMVDFNNPGIMVQTKTRLTMTKEMSTEYATSVIIGGILLMIHSISPEQFIRDMIQLQKPQLKK